MPGRTRIVVVGVLAAAVWLAGCKNSGREAAASALGFLPAQTRTVMGINFEAIRSSKIYPQIEPVLRRLIESNADLAMLSIKCKIDPLVEVHSVVIGVGQDLEDENAMFFAVTGLDRKAFEGCVANMDGMGERVHADGAFTRITDDGESLLLWWPSSTTLVSTPGTKGGSETLKALAGGAPAVTANATVMAQINRIDNDVMVWMVGAPPLDGAAAAKFAQLGGPPKNHVLSIDAPSGLDAKVVLTFANDATAKKVDDWVKAELVQLEQQPVVGAYFKAVEHAHSGTEVTVRLSLAKDEFEQLLGLVRMAQARM